ncbi:hypothetical protein A3A46_00555 [Candidatus Roizmanbacteria bacterium RIFCSPLOWO2_01_FULL_37_13]|uniref:Glycosyltransferase RgtA/B/C/D-like domain-containing protein n=1 Tax=Candidatus Roizmanbacteria bacterium RIFCSPHIGHO2_01_FULL_39_8 TaxID=1802033 RepID=A0A1F7GT21_9BACT|nr:MAG: hypothetical protein A2866_06790 [Candidatus Roizmanbacteria bacterium RIFCSPHIGHO2_01_FULL_39_8]OGK41878.1 MAG: hypothetical protein A3A46_00555 [Candidatus Roizmanbacteria bacterium RIFCSPLOWO2_01_FULL_37_13]
MKNALTILLLLILATGVYLTTIRGTIGNPVIGKDSGPLAKATGPFESSHERAPYALLVSLVESKSLSLTRTLVNFASPDTVFSKDKFFIIFPPGISFIAIPFYVLGKFYNVAQLATFGGMMIFAVLNLIFLFLISNKIFKLSTSISFISALIFGFASTSLSYATSLYQHHLTTFLVLSSFYAAYIYKFGKSSRWLTGIWIWASVGFCLWIDYPTVLFMIPVVVYMFLNSFNFEEIKGIYKVSFSIIFLLTMSVLLFITGINGYYNQKNFGSWKQIAQLLPRYDSSKIKNSKDKKSLPTISKRELSKSVSGVAREDKVVNGLYILSIAPDKGLFFFSPIYILAILGILLAIKKKEKYIVEIGILVAIFLVNLIFFSSWGDPWGGWAYGPRYLVPSMAILSIFVAYWVEKTKYQIVGRTTAFFLAAYSVFIAILGAYTTTATPPKVEADYLKLKYGYFLNLDFFEQGKTGSFIFKEYLSKYITFHEFFLIILGLLIVIFYLFLFVPPLLEENTD